MRLHRIILAVQVYFFVLAEPAFADSLDGYPLLRESYDPGLQEKLEATLDRLRLSSYAARGKLSVVLVDISDLKDPRLASVNGDRMLYAASLPKLAILLGAFVEIERGAITLDAPTRRKLTAMIRVSSNEAATEMLNRIGKQRLLNILRSNRFRLYDEAVNGGLWVGKEYAPTPAYARDPLHHTSHGATAIQTARLYYLMVSGQLFDARLTSQMKAMLAKPGIQHKFVKGLAGIPGLEIYRKSGTWRIWHADSVLVEAGRHRYILVGLAEHPQGGEWLARMAAPLHRVITGSDLAQVPE